MGTEFIVPMAIKVIMMIIFVTAILIYMYLYPVEGERRTIIHHHHTDQHEERN
jgi:amino acid permease